ncbi:MaoC family dehydratase [Algihabitans albus]|uniref:MaoC family dehydratase n=1 Tax=Algihabitans albus TaxID=2164067 RepID=UPI001ABBFBD3|nr:MaoC family dehydratase [Algihabitans albus]
MSDEPPVVDDPMKAALNARSNAPGGEPRCIGRLSDLPDLIGGELGRSDWMPIESTRIRAFAEATEDRQWIHLDKARAATESPFGSTVAHGYLTLSLLPHLSATAFTVAEVRLRVNYGLGRVRFPAPVLSDSRIRARFTLADARPHAASGGLLVTLQAVVDLESGTRPACIAEMLALYLE